MGGLSNEHLSLLAQEVVCPRREAGQHSYIPGKDSLGLFPYIFFSGVWRGHGDERGERERETETHR